MQPENKLDDLPDQHELRLKMRTLREEKIGSYEKASGELGFNKNTIASYEKGLTLPDIDFLFVFADRTGADINELIRLRLACSKYESTRALVGAVQVAQPVAPEAPRPTSPDVTYKTPVTETFDGQKDMLESLLRICEYKIMNNEITPQVIKTALGVVDNWMSVAIKHPELETRLKAVAAAYRFFEAAGPM